MGQCSSPPKDVYKWSDLAHSCEDRESLRCIFLGYFGLTERFVQLLTPLIFCEISYN